MERTFLLLAAFIFSSGQCQDTDPSRDPDASLTVCKPDICRLIRDSGVYSAQILELQRLIQEQAQQLQEQAQQLKALQETTSAAVPRFAFTAALGQVLGPVSIHTTVRYQAIISNMGNGYNPATGIFTARVSGMYYFSYTINDSATNAAVLHLEAGDNVYTQLFATREVHDDGMRYNTFSGFLLFPL
ncbi:unnamed protein product [Boreogadus saida]